MTWVRPAPLRPFKSTQDSHRVYCRHTALEPLEGFDKSGSFHAIRLQCTNCNVILEVESGQRLDEKEDQDERV